MIYNYSGFKVKIKPIEYKHTDNQIFSCTAAVSFYDKSKKEIYYKEMGYLDNEEIFKLIDEEKPINLDNCYIENFNLNLYRKRKSLPEESVVKIKGFSAQDAFFDSDADNSFNNVAFLGDVNFNGASFLNGNVSFKGAVFGGLVNFSYVHFKTEFFDFSQVVVKEGLVTFKNAVFSEGKKDFQDTDFGSGSLEFVNTEFNAGDVSFINTDFSVGKVSFKIARFGNGIKSFHFAKFSHGDISFERTDFGCGKLDMRKVEFGFGKINFNRAVFGDIDVTFEDSELEKGKMTFKKAHFGSGVLNFENILFPGSLILFDNTDFGQGNVYFGGANVQTLKFYSGHLNNYFDLRLKRCKELVLEDSIVRDIIDMTPDKSCSGIHTLNIVGLRLLGRIYIDWRKNHVYKAITRVPELADRQYAEQFRILKENFNNIGLYDDEDRAYVEFKKFEMLADRDEVHEDDSWLKKTLRYPLYWFKWLVFDKAGCFATNPIRVMESMVITYVFFSLMYFAVIKITGTGIVSGIGGEHDTLSVLGRSFYHSAITFLTIGYGDFYPFGAVRWISGLEGFVGLFLMSYFTVAFVRKILR